MFSLLGNRAMDQFAGAIFVKFERSTGNSSHLIGKRRKPQPRPSARHPILPTPIFNGTKTAIFTCSALLSRAEISVPVNPGKRLKIFQRN